ncbi:hypothetical protein GMMP1_990102 [Candidatus Magnetomoraceae bacterium gMMP-1]
MPKFPEPEVDNAEVLEELTPDCKSEPCNVLVSKFISFLLAMCIINLYKTINSSSELSLKNYYTKKLHLLIYDLLLNAA